MDSASMNQLHVMEKTTAFPLQIVMMAVTKVPVYVEKTVKMLGVGFSALVESVSRKKIYVMDGMIVTMAVMKLSIAVVRTVKK